MKKIHLIAVLAIFALSIGITGCDNTISSNPDITTNSTAATSMQKASTVSTSYPSNGGTGTFAGYNEATDNPTYGSYLYTLWAGKQNNAGVVTITNDKTNIYVTYNTNETADLGEVHVYVWTSLASIPDKRPAPGLAPYKATNLNADSYTVTIPMPVACGSTFYVSTHAALVADATGGSVSNAVETAYAGTVVFPNASGSWWGYVSYTVNCFYDISGTVSFNGTCEAPVILTLSGNSGTYTVAADDNGNYAFNNLPGGTSTVTAVTAADVVSQTLTATITLSGSDKTQNFVFECKPKDDDNDGTYGTETAFAYGGAAATDFLMMDFDNNGRKDFNRWGWSNGPLTAGVYTFDIYAGAGQSDITKGTKVGTLTVNYNGSTAAVTYSMKAGFTMSETHLYVGNDPLAKNNGTYTVAPGQYPNIHAFANTSSDSYTVAGLSGQIYVVAHAVVSGKY